jgi:hypothetical protein
MSKETPSIETNYRILSGLEHAVKRTAKILPDARFGDAEKILRSLKYQKAKEKEQEGHRI